MIIDLRGAICAALILFVLHKVILTRESPLHPLGGKGQGEGAAIRAIAEGLGDDPQIPEADFIICAAA